MQLKRADFPILKQTINGKPLCYLDNAATSQKPQSVIDAVVNFYTTTNSNIYRGAHFFSEQATMLYEQARAGVAQFIRARDTSEIIFTRGCTEGINFVATAWAMKHINPGDEIVITGLEHHANMVPWQNVAAARNAILKVIPVHPDGSLIIDNLDSIITEKTKLLACIHVSNALGTHVPVERLIMHAKQVGAYVLIDAAQSVGHQKVNVVDLDCDFLVFSGHKMLAPTGIGVLYIRQELHDIVDPYQFGGGMVFEVDYQKASYLKSPQKFEAGTPPIAQVIGLGAAVNYLQQIDFEQLRAHEAQLCAQLIDGLASIDRVRMLGPLDQLKKQGHLVSFVVEGIHAHDVAAYLSQEGICVRAGDYCTQPLFKKMHLSGSVRASFYLYNTAQEIDRLLVAVDQLITVFK
jgi:cysteine desulfurase/selenocysteine lyase